MKSNISFMLFAYNEEKRISYAINNFIKYGEVYILDGGSTDRTKEIAEKLGAKFFVRPVSPKIHAETVQNLNFIKSIISTDWIYWGYVDNIAPKKLVEKMVELSQQDEILAANIPLYTYLWGNTKEYAHKSYCPFLFHKDYVDFTNNYTHGFGTFLGKPEQKIFLENQEEYALKHFSTYISHKFIQNHLRYAEDEALEKYERGEKYSTIKMLAAILRYTYIYGKYCYRYGALGLLIVLHYAVFRVMAYTKLYELEHGITLEGVEENYSRKKEKLLKDFD